VLAGLWLCNQLLGVAAAAVPMAPVVRKGQGSAAGGHGIRMAA